MSKKRSKQTRVPEPPSPSVPAAPPAKPAALAMPFGVQFRDGWPVLAVAAVFFLFLCLTTVATIKWTAMVVVIAAIAALFLRFSAARERLNLLFAAVTLWVVFSGVSTLYAVSGKFALYEFLKLLAAYAVFVLFTVFARKGRGAGRGFATILACASALAGLLSIDLLSTHILSGAFQGLMGLFSTDYAELSGVEPGVRMMSIFFNPNVFAGVAGIGVLLSLGLANSSETAGERRFHQCCLFFSALAFVLAFSMGATGTICIAFLALVLLESKERRAPMLVLMVETLILTLLAAVPVFATSFDGWSGFQPVPLLCAAGGAAVLCFLDQLVGRRVGEALGAHGKAALGLLAVLVAALGVFAALALTLTGGVSLSTGEHLRRADYPAPGTYTMEVDAGEGLDVYIESQNRQDTMMHTSTALYNGPASGAAFTVPEDSTVVYFNFYANGETRLESASYSGENGGSQLKLGYKLLPGFIANRLQGLFANQNAIQRLVFFEDGMKLFRQSPIVGLGMGAFEGNAPSVQSFFYATKYVHNHYIQMLIDTGIIGLALFLAVLGIAAAAVLRGRKNGGALTASLGAALVFLAGHALTEIILSTCHYLPMAFGVLALIGVTCGERVKMPAAAGENVRGWLVAGTAALLGAYAVLLGCNMRAQWMFDNLGGDPFTELKTCVALDRFEWMDYELTYVTNVRPRDQEDPKIHAQADEYAYHLSQASSNIVPLYLAEYYFKEGRTVDGFAMIEKYVSFVASSSETWQNGFHMMERYAQDTPEFRSGVLEVYDMFLSWNAGHMGELSLDEQSLAFLQRMGV